MPLLIGLLLALHGFVQAAPFEARTLDVPGAPAASLPALPSLPALSAPPAAPAAPLTTPAEDRILYRAIELARKSKSQRARFGAVVVDMDGRIIGEGWNRVPDVLERRLIGVGQIMHAEQAATAQALLKVPAVRRAVTKNLEDRDAAKAAVARAGGLLDGARLYVVGISKDGLHYFQKIEAGIACEICARTLGHFHVDAMSSSAQGFVRLPWDRLLEIAKTKPKWWQHAYKGKAPDPNIRWLPVAELESRVDAAPSVDERLRGFRKAGGRDIVNGVQFRQARAPTPDVLTLRIKRFFFDKILSGEKKFEYRVRSPQNDALIEAARKRGAKFLRLHFQDNDVQLLARIDKIDVVPGKDASEPWDAAQGLAPSGKPHWRIAISSPRLIWDNPKARAALKFFGRR